VVDSGKIATDAVVLDDEGHLLGEVGKGLSLDALTEALLEITPSVGEDVGLLPPILEDKAQQLLSPGLPEGLQLNVSHEVRLLLEALPFTLVHLVLPTHAG
jgi:hypothetical protein